MKHAKLLSTILGLSVLISPTYSAFPVHAEVINNDLLYNYENIEIEEEVADPTCVSLTGHTPYVPNEYRQYVIDRCEDIISQVITPNMSDIEKYMAIARWENGHVSYDKESDYCSSPYGALKYGKAKCEGYATLYAILCHAADLPCDTIEIPESLNIMPGGHLLNYLPNINGHDYLCDITWNRMFMTLDTAIQHGTPYTYKEGINYSFEKYYNYKIVCDYHDFVSYYNSSSQISCILHANSDTPSTYCFDNAIDPYTEKGSGIQGQSYAKYEDYALKQPLNTGDWKYDDFFYHPQAVKNHNILSEATDIYIPDKEFDGSLEEVIKEIDSCLVVSFMGQKLVLNQDYTISYEFEGINEEDDETNDNHLIIYINGINDYNGSTWETCRTKNRFSGNIDEATISGLKASYDGKLDTDYISAIQNDIKVQMNSIYLKEDVDYVLDCRMDDNTVEVYVAGMGIYYGEKLIYYKNLNPNSVLDITKTSISGLKNTYSEKNTADYINAIKQDLILTYNQDKNDYILNEGSDYTLAYRFIKYPDKNDYLGYVEAHGVNNFTGTLIIKEVYTPLIPDEKTDIEIELEIGKKINYEKLKNPDNDFAYHISVSDSTIANITSDGTITAYKEGSTKATVSSSTVIYNVSIIVKEKQKPSKMIITGQSVDIKSAFFADIEDNDHRIARYTVHDAETRDNVSKSASVSNKGILSAKKPCTVEITPQYKEGKHYYNFDKNIEVTILHKPVIRFTNPLTYKGQTVNIFDHFADNWMDNDVKPIEMTSSNTNVATIDENGVITAGATNGTATINLIYSQKNRNFATNTFKVTAKITVKQPKFAKASYQMQTGQNLAIGMSNVTRTTDIEWSTSDPDKLSVVAQLDKKGVKTGKALLTAHECGEYTLTGTIDGQNYNCEIIVKEPAIKKATLRIKCGKTGTVALKNTRINKNDIVWQSSNEEIATVSAGGIITTKNIGDVIIYTETGGVRNECNVTVW